MLRELAAMVRGGKVSSSELVTESIARIAASNAPLGAVVLMDEERALRTAAQIDSRRQRGEHLGALAGLPLLVKDIEDVAGLRTTHGSLTRREAAPAQQSGHVPTRLMAADAVVIGKTNTPEFSFEAYTSNRLFGDTRNPWSPEWSPGGSSGGSAAALAAGYAPLATATDGGGSIRIPAALCGLVGLKPTVGVVPRSPIPAWIDLSTDGPMGTSVDDVELLLELISGPVPGDPNAVPHGTLRDPETFGTPRLLAAPRTYDWGPLPTDVQACFDTALERLETCLGQTAERVSPSSLFTSGNPDTDWFILCGVEQAHQLGRDFIESNADILDPVFLGHMRFGLEQTTERYIAARRARFVYTAELDALLGDDAILVTPTLGITGLTPDGVAEGLTKPGTLPDALNTVIQNITGNPAVTLPAGRHQNGVPFGLQLTGPRYSDRWLLEIARRWEEAHPWELSAPGYVPYTPEGLGLS
jgi:Asp-tRNA(Asn)/Glu-tRNA(Gln) amidotransferase A subunit family amidase